MPCAHTQTRPKKQGFTLIEAAVVMGIVGLIAGAIWVGASSALLSATSHTMQKNMMIMAAKMREMYQNKNYVLPTGSLNDIMINIGVVPADMVKTVGTTKSIQDPWGNPVEISRSGLNARTAIMRMHFSTHACIRTLASLTSSGATDGFGVYQGNSNYDQVLCNYEGVGSPACDPGHMVDLSHADVSDVASLCEMVHDQEQIDVMFNLDGETPACQIQGNASNLAC